EPAGADGAAVLDAIPQAHREFVARLFAKYGVPLPDGPAGAAGLGAETADVARRVTAEGATRLIDTALKHPIRLIASALGPPPPVMVERARAAGVPVAALVGSVEHARRQVAAGV